MIQDGRKYEDVAVVAKPIAGPRYEAYNIRYEESQEGLETRYTGLRLQNQTKGVNCFLSLLE